MFSGVKKRMKRENAHNVSSADVGQDLVLDGMRVTIDSCLAEGAARWRKGEGERGQ